MARMGATARTQISPIGSNNFADRRVRQLSRKMLPHLIKACTFSPEKGRSPWRVARARKAQASLRSPKPGGFTLIELMVVLALIGILTAMIVPEMRGTYEDSLLRSTARQLVDLVGLASSRAVSQDEVFRLHFGSRAGRYRLERRQPQAGESDHWQPVADLPGADGSLDPRIAVTISAVSQEQESLDESAAGPTATDSNSERAPHAVAFYPDGTADRAEFRLRDRQGFGLALRINPVTAQVRIVELDRAVPGAAAPGSTP
jgi:type II secretion system protein H